ncbi:glycosyltransferase, partial [Opitutales bacterium]|nr:glycosyltransferase [Opitutales bacterium]
MNNNINISLITATYGRYDELNQSLVSLRKSHYDVCRYEIIIVDQNPVGYLDKLLINYNDLNIIHLNSKRKGLSFNRNLGLKLASGDIVCFPDDDCQYYDETLSTIEKVASKYSNTPFFIARINNDRLQNEIVERKWTHIPFSVNLYNFYLLANSNSMFIRRDSLLTFNESMGVGATYGSSEDVDLLYRILKNSNISGLYCPTIQVSHPDPAYKNIPLDKIKSYSRGFGFFVRNDFDIHKFLYIILLVAKKIFQFIYSLFNS